MKELIVSKLEDKEDEIYIKINIKDNHNLVRKRVEELGLSNKELSRLINISEDFIEWFLEEVR